jgi:hypothetical protein
VPGTKFKPGPQDRAFLFYGKRSGFRHRNVPGNKFSFLEILNKHITDIKTVNPIDFITIIKRETFDYTEWRTDLFKDVPLGTFLKKAEDFRKQGS